ncbi:shikimate dehydrogenase family protein [Neptunitalea lumnitzerae]|uniref:Shikimate 5-dehydrogenase n=1 Tax=Neptunitalea lumnitzerae TaxID=2965509 RepID=A0ABQ5MKG5_9FLAO|nr:shikimate dehydrogenase [Neptunitalea sp. Y10]GLB49905.1 shikimate 5-dehydrogenase [Neptunitalea sp. Y10]
MEVNQKNDYKYLFGLVGKNINYSFSRGYFKTKFENEHLTNCFYTNFDIPSIEEFPKLIKQHPNIKGFNVTIPYKESIIPYLDTLDDTAKSIGAVNTIEVKDSKLIGHNTDYYGFMKSLEPNLNKNHTKALILGTGGAAKAVAYVMRLLKIDYNLVSRTSKPHQLTYNNLNTEILDKYHLIINTTPLGTFPEISNKPDIPYNLLTEKHLLFDLIYNPEKTTFLTLGEEKGASIANGSKMLVLQAEKAWEIWKQNLNL